MTSSARAGTPWPQSRQESREQRHLSHPFLERPVHQAGRGPLAQQRLADGCGIQPTGAEKGDEAPATLERGDVLLEMVRPEVSGLPVFDICGHPAHEL